MSRINFSSAQKEAIIKRGKKILVSAGAGSGKTAVLTERVIHLILEEVPLERLVVLTFTNAAANEMKARIRKRLRAEKASTVIKNALAHLDVAHIQTFDSYALYVLKKFGHYINVSRHVSIGDAIALSSVKNKLIGQLFNQYFEQENESFLEYVRTFATKDDRLLQEQVLFFYEQMSLLGDIDQTCTWFGKGAFNQARFSTLFADYERIIFAYQEAFNSTLNQLENVSNHPAFITFFERIKANYATFLNAKDYQSMYDFFKELPKFPNSAQTTIALRKEDDEATIDTIQQYKGDLKDILKHLKEKWLAQSKEAHLGAFLKSAQHIGLITELIQSFDKKFVAWQIKHEIMSFSTVARLALRLIKTYPDIKNALKNEIDELMIDEYQDTNLLQESFVNALTHQNIYMVGDVKQSIYRFRHAECALFMEKHHTYPKLEEALRIDLHTNYRSHKNMLIDINNVFQTVMNEKIGGVDYTDAQRLNAGKDFQADETGLQLHHLNDEAVPPHLRDIAELAHIAEDIKTKNASGINYQDMTILAETSTKYELIKQVFEHQGIPLKVIKDEPFMKYIDVDTYRQIFTLLHAMQDDEAYRKHFKHALMSVARSYLFNIDDDTLLNQVMHLPSSRHQLSEQSFINHPFKSFFNNFFNLEQHLATHTLETLFDAIIKTFNLYGALSRLPQTQAAWQRLDYLQLIIKSLSDQGYGLCDLIDYFKYMLNAKIDVEFDTSAAIKTDAVSLMTIHKSKGLEFPIVYIPFTIRKFNRTNMRSYDFDKTLGFLIEHEDEGLAQSFLFTLKNNQNLEADISERLRVLYVALTRAEKTVIVPTWPNKERPIRKNDQQHVIDYDKLHQFKSQHDILMATKEHIEKQYVITSDIALLEDIHASTEHPKPLHIKRKAVRQYPDEFKRIKRVENRSYSAGINTLLTKEALAHIELGNALHEYFELLDFKRDINHQIDTLVQDLTIQKLLKQFFKSPLIRGLSIINVYKEFPFALEQHEETLSGFIDLLIETKDKFLLIDYKLKQIDKAAYDKQIQGYYDILSTLTDKPIEGYLYSIVDGKFKQVV